MGLTLLAALFFALTARDGIISTNDGSHFALTKALATSGTARIDPYIELTAIQPPNGPVADRLRDVSQYQGHFYSDRPPGTAFLAVPFYWLGVAVSHISGRGDLDFPQLYVTMLPPLLGAAVAAALYALARGLGAGPVAAAVTAASGALTTLVLKYATLLYSHIGGAACVTGALAAVLAAERFPARSRWFLVAGGALLGYSAVVEYPNLLLIAPVGLYLLWRTRGRDVAVFAIAWGVAVLPVVLYNWLCFGRPWRTSYTDQYYFTWTHSLRTTYVTPLWTGLRWLLVGPAGLLIVTPALVLALWGLALLARRQPARALLLAGVVLTILLPTTMHRTYYGGGSQDTRYLLAIVPTLYAPLAVWLSVVARWRPAPVRWLCWLAFAALCVWGVLRSYLSLLTMFGHAAVERSPGAAFALLRAHWRDLAIVAPGLRLEHYFLVLVVPLAGLFWLGWQLRPSPFISLSHITGEGEPPAGGGGEGMA
ncbi:MAG: hypothetical protein ACTHMP_19515 [Thermomicrobiales bacterium]